jgi:hypothetical protein
MVLNQKFEDKTRAKLLGANLELDEDGNVWTGKTNKPHIGGHSFYPGYVLHMEVRAVRGDTPGKLEYFYTEEVKNEKDEKRYTVGLHFDETGKTSQVTIWNYTPALEALILPLKEYEAYFKKFANHPVVKEWKEFHEDKLAAIDHTFRS